MSKEDEDLEALCVSSLKNKKLDNDPNFYKRLRWELEEIKAKNKSNYFLDLYKRKVFYPSNENNLLICWLLGIVSSVDINKEPRCEYGDYPDIDVDFIPVVREYLKNTWAPSTFGEEYVCNIGNYTTFGIKSALIDMARVHGESRDEILALTKNLDAKDDEGKAMTWDSAMKLNPDLKKYCDRYPEIAESAKKLLNRNRGMGVHAGGLIISNSPLPELVPLVKRKDNPQASAWVEGLHGQDLQPVGLVKFDLLVISNLLQIAKCCELVKNRHNLKGICALEGQADWSDVKAWRNDSVALEMANSGDLKGIFQFDSETVRGMCQNGGVDRFEDLVAYTSLNRPGPLNMKMQERYIERKRGREDYSLHSLIEPILGDTYGVMIYQEQVMKILNVVGEIPLKDCELVRKAISKKKIDSFIKYKEMFVRNGQKNLGVNEKEVEDLWRAIEAFSEYGFNKSHAVAYSYVSAYLLYLKSHYPHEFYTSILSCETLSDKIKEYKMEAKLHDVNVLPIEVNRSKVNFDLQGEDIYFGLSNVKGVGEAPAKRIVDLQPFSGFEDFLERFGTDANVLKPLIGLRCFNESDPVTLWKFSECYKLFSKRNEDKKKRYIAALEKYEEEFKELFPEESIRLSDIKGDSPFEDPYWIKYNADGDQFIEKRVECDKDDEGAYAKVVNTPVTLDCGLTIEKETVKYYKKVKVRRNWNRLVAFRSLWNKRNKSIERYKLISKNSPTLATFDPSKHDIDGNLEEELSNLDFCENKYYGFSWIHPLENSPDYRGNLTFNNLKASEDVAVGAVEIKVLKATKTKSKKGTEYYQIQAEDVTGQSNKIIVWLDDWERWSEELSPNNLLRIRLQPPSNGFATFTLESNSSGFRWKGVKKYPDKKDDIRIVVLIS
jgi:DNA polymerase III alpha subunit